MTKIKGYLQEKDHATWFLFILLFFLLLSKNLIFHKLVFLNSFNLGFWQYLIAKIAAPLFLSSFVFITRTRWWSAILVILADLLAIISWIYYRANGLFVSVKLISVIGNLRGFSSSIISYIDSSLFLFIIPTLLFLIVLYFFPKERERKWILYIITLPLSLIAMCANSYLIHSIKASRGLNNTELTFERMLPLYLEEERLLAGECEYHILQEHSILEYIPLNLVYEYKLEQYKKLTRNEGLSDEEKCLIDKLIQEKTGIISPNSNLVIVLVESLESWVLEYSGIMPCTINLINRDHTLFADKIKSQVRHGVSGDGQMIINTGLLPVQSGVTSVLYGTNVYPNIAQYYPLGFIVNPSIGTWNQNVVTYSYGYKELIEPMNRNLAWDDADILQHLWQHISTKDSLFCSLAITWSSHSPFTNITTPVPSITADIPDEMKRYLTCLHYTDSCIGVLIDSLQATGMLSNTTLVITGDHIIFRPDKLETFHSYAQEHNLSIKNGKNYVPLIIYSPEIESSMLITDECYQMDIYPTLRSILSIENSLWKGFGVNLSDSVSLRQRTITEEEAYRLSNKLIICNWFANYSFVE